MKASLLALLLAAFAAFVPPASAADTPPDELVRQVTRDVLDAIGSDRELAAGNRAKALALAEAKVLPHVDFREAARLATSRAWTTATPEQQERIVKEFRSMLVRLYSSSIDAYRGQTMRVQPAKLAPGATETTVRNQYVRPGQPPILVDYAMRKTPQGWKIFDIVVEGVSLVLTYRSEFEQVARQSGVDGLIQRLSEKNRAG